jgi:hypothetical protein
MSRLQTLLDKAHSKRGITSFEIAELAHLRGIPASAPLKVIFSPLEDAGRPRRRPRAPTPTRIPSDPEMAVGDPTQCPPEADRPAGA